MPSLKLAVLAVATALVSTVRADYYIQPDSVPLSLRQYWCSSEISTCPIICAQNKPYSTKTNTCDPKTLTYGCVCGDGLQPNISEYSLTLPYFVCEEWGNQCVTACAGDNSCSSDCRQNHPCGALDPTRANASASASATASNTASASDTIYTGLGSGSGSSSGSPSTTKTNSAGRSIEVTRALMGAGLTLGGLAAGFALAL
ncbi:uncharacterized protein SPSK_04558 [Sporothrix schenckii 1099-18]|uniref:DUF7707 domain-containing protein n=2 Tax=Sporothrix schenckii TaxID=29908 RepID=U7PXJ1_SPOS1|nr:uncharacterized protein SPSK_04558 [Sporothrix schenckii 1099-18]ERS99190.1 hypothetical protein HMPREF1624_04386 [Sporothrix schenckii ATCC 58251]KJR83135.1 hypothetical protein SPSK_04558 [Sporothrix schenckii 1099-18]